MTPAGSAGETVFQSSVFPVRAWIRWIEAEEPRDSTAKIESPSALQAIGNFLPSDSGTGTADPSPTAYSQRRASPPAAATVRLSGETAMELWARSTPSGDWARGF